MKKSILLIILLALLACSEQPKKKSSQWITLFDGTSLDGWEGLQRRSNATRMENCG